MYVYTSPGVSLDRRSDNQQQLRRTAAAGQTAAGGKPAGSRQTAAGGTAGSRQTAAGVGTLLGKLGDTSLGTVHGSGTKLLEALAEAAKLLTVAVAGAVAGGSGELLTVAAELLAVAAELLAVAEPSTVATVA